MAALAEEQWSPRPFSISDLGKDNALHGGAPLRGRFAHGYGARYPNEDYYDCSVQRNPHPESKAHNRRHRCVDNIATSA